MNILKRIVIGTPLEQPARRLYSRLTGPAGCPPPSITEWDLRGARDNAYMRALLRYTLKPGSNCIDVGAHAGDFLRQFLQLAPEGRHWAFEPIPALAEALRREFPAAEVHASALSDRGGQALFQYVPDCPSWSGLRPQPYPTAALPQSIPVELERLDDVIPQDVPITFVKIDVEGAELQVLRGGESLIRRWKPVILFECGRIHHANYDTTPQDVYEFFAGCGLGIFLLDLTGPLTEARFAEIYEASHRSNYDREAWTNFVAKPE